MEAGDLNNETLEYQVPTMIYGSWYTLFDAGSLTWWVNGLLIALIRKGLDGLVFR